MKLRYLTLYLLSYLLTLPTLSSQVINTEFNTKLTTSSGSMANAYGVHIQLDGKIIVGGNFELVNGQPISCLVRLLPDGTIDSTFNRLNNKVEGLVNGIVENKFGDLIIYGDYYEVPNDSTYNGLSLFSKDGDFIKNLDFPPAGNSNLEVRYSAQDSEGDIYFGGGDIHPGLKPLVKYNFIQPGIFSYVNYSSQFSGDWRMHGLEITSDDKLLVIGQDINFQDGGISSIIQINKDGSRDENFIFPFETNYWATDIIELSNQKYLIAGGESVDQVFYPKATILNPDGTIHQELNYQLANDNTATSYIFNYYKLANNNIVVAGWFDSFNQIPVSADQVIINEAGVFVDEFLPEIRATTIYDMKYNPTDSSYIVVGRFETEEAGVSIAKIKFISNGISTLGDLPNSLNIYPSPATNVLNFNVEEDQIINAETQVQIIELASGKIVYQEQMVLEEENQIPISKLFNGNYVLQLVSNKFKISTPFVKL